MAHPDLDRLLNVLLPFATESLAKAGEFYPFGAALDADGTPAMMAGYDGHDQPTVEAVIEHLMGGLRDKASKGEITTAGICLDAWVTLPEASERTDAIEARLEHASGAAVRVFLPYVKGFEGKPKFGELFAAPWEGGIFEGPPQGNPE